MFSRPEFWCKFLRQREEGGRRGLGSTNQLSQQLYSTILPSFSWIPEDSVKHTHHGGIFNLEFSPDGGLLVAATERKSILVFDPLNHRLINSVDKAHNDCVNYARFLDSRMFATCSDDTTVALWDIRYLKHKIRSLKGHSNWVKNIEYASSSGLLVTSGFDGSIYTWDINRYSEQDVQFQQVFHANGLMRMRLTPDDSKMVICTTGGYLMVIHNLDFSRLAYDLKGFKPYLYRLMQNGDSPFPVDYTYNHLFSCKTNRVELISDFPLDNEAEIISSLQVHPHGWCVLSRNTSGEESSEWTCVHDIQESGKEELVENPPAPPPSANPRPNNFNNNTPSFFDWPNIAGRGVRGGGPLAQELRDRPVVHIRVNYGLTPSSSPNSNPLTSGSRSGQIVASRLGASNSSRELTETVNNDGTSTTERFRFGNIELRISRRRNVNPMNPTVSSNTNSPAQAASETAEENNSSSGSEEFGGMRSASAGVTASASPAEVIIRETPAFFIQTGSELGARTYLVLGPSRSSRLPGNSSGASTSGTSSSNSLDFPNSVGPYKIVQNSPRLTHYAKEPNVGRGFIKELCFSTDGRLVCSPFGYGVRLLAFDPQCAELCDSIPQTPAPLHELATSLTHKNYVVSTKFSPVHCLLVSGCLSGKVTFHQPLF